MTDYVYFTAQGGAAPNNVTTADTGSGNPPTTVTRAGTGPVNRYSTQVVGYGTVSVELATGGGAGGTAANVWGFTAGLDGTFRFYLRTPSAFTGSPLVCRIRGSAGGTQCLRIRWDATGHLEILNTSSSSTGAGGTTTDAMSTSSVYRVEVRCAPGSGAGTGAGSVRFWPIGADSGNADAGKTASVTGQNFGSTNQVGEFTIGQVVTFVSLPSWYHAWLTAISGVGVDIGPAVESIDGTAASTATLTGALTVDRVVDGDRATTDTLTGTLTVDRVIAGDRPTTDVLTGTLAVDRVIDGDRPTTAGLTGALTVDRAIDGDRVTTAGLTGDLAVDRPITGDRPTVAGLTGDLAADRPISGDRPTVATLAGSLAVDASISGDRPTTAGLTGDLAVDRTIDGTRTVTAGLTGTLAVDAGIDGDRPTAAGLTGTLAADMPIDGDRPTTAGLIGELAVDGAIDGDRPVVAGFTGDIDVIPPGGIVNIDGDRPTTAGLVGELQVITPDRIIEPLLDAALACLCEKVATHPSPPAVCCHRVGDHVTYGRPECCEGLAWVRLVSATPLDPGVHHCGIPQWAVTIDLGIARCAPIGTGERLPTCDEWATLVAATLLDGRLLRATVCCIQALAAYRDLVVQNIAPHGPEGGCTDTTLTVTVNVVGCDEC